MKKRIVEMLKQGRAYTDIVREIGCSKATISYHAKKMGTLAPRSTYDWGRIQAYYDEGHSYRQCREQFGFASQSWSKAVKRGVIRAREPKLPLRELLQENRKGSRTHLRRRLLQEGVLENRCSRCGFSKWMGQELSCHLIIRTDAKTTTA